MNLIAEDEKFLNELENDNSKDAEIEARLGLLGTPFSNSTMTRQLIKFPLYFLRHLSDQYNYPTF